MLAAWLLASSALLPRAAAQPADTWRPPTISITAVVTDARGRPVSNLTRDDFTLRDEGTTRALETAEFRRGGGRLFAIFFDEFHVEAGPSTARARDALARFVDEETTDTDRLVAMKPLDPVTSIQVTADRTAIRRAIDGFAGRMGDYAPRSAFEAEYMSRAPEAAAIERARVVQSDLTALAAQIGSVQEMPKAILLVTESAASDLRRVARAANRTGVAVYVIDPREAPQETSAALRALAVETGGTLTPGGTDLTAALSRVAKDLDEYYVLTYRAAPPPDGRFHTLEIAARRAGLQVRARRGYWSPLPAVRRAAGPATSFPLADMLAAHVSNLIQPWFRMTRGPRGRTRVTFSWQPSQAASARSAPEVLQLTAATPDGTALFRGKVAPDVPNAPPDESTPSRIVFDVPPGRLRTDMQISDGAARMLDRDVRFLEIPDFYGPAVIMTAPEILRTRTAREFRLLASQLDATPSLSREFNRFERLLIRVHAYGPDARTPEVTASLVNAVGQPLHALERVPAAADGLVQFDLPLSTLARGNYSVQIAASVDSSRTSQLIPIRIIG
jgi:VWFA-related protein